MKREVRFTPAARLDMIRLSNFLVEKSARAADRSQAAISAAIRSLSENPDRGRPAHENYRELRIKFGRDGYVAQYRVDPDVVLVARIFHARESR